MGHFSPAYGAYRHRAPRLMIGPPAGRGCQCELAAGPGGARCGLRAEYAVSSIGALPYKELRRAAGISIHHPSTGQNLGLPSERAEIRSDGGRRNGWSKPISNQHSQSGKSPTRRGEGLPGVTPGERQPLRPRLSAVIDFPQARPGSKLLVLRWRITAGGLLAGSQYAVVSRSDLRRARAGAIRLGRDRMAAAAPASTCSEGTQARDLQTIHPIKLLGTRTLKRTGSDR